MKNMTREDLERLLANPEGRTPTDELREAASAAAALWEGALLTPERYRRYCASERQYWKALGRCGRSA